MSKGTFSHRTENDIFERLTLISIFNESLNVTSRFQCNKLNRNVNCMT